MKRKGNGAIFALLLLLLILAAFLATALGSANIKFSSILAALFGGGGETENIILFSLRLPRVAASILAGMGLSVSGLILQTVTGNDLCSPSIIGVNSGAGFAVMVFLCVFPMAHAFLPAAAFLGAFGATLVVLSSSMLMSSRDSKATVILAGVAISTLLSAGISFLSQLYPDVLPSYTSFSVGSFSGVYSEDLAIPAIIIAAGCALALWISPKLNLLCLGEDMAYSLGVNVKRLRMISLVLSSALCAAVVSFAGLLGFVGLVVPHIGRKIVGSDVRTLMPACALLGSILTLIADLIGRTLFSPSELPAGIIVSAVGAPFFIYLLLRRSKAND